MQSMRRFYFISAEQNHKAGVLENKQRIKRRKSNGRFSSESPCSSCIMHLTPMRHPSTVGWRRCVFFDFFFFLRPVQKTKKELMSV